MLEEIYTCKGTAGNECGMPRRCQNPSKKPPKSRSGGTKIEVWRVPGSSWVLDGYKKPPRRFGDTFLTPLGRLLGPIVADFSASWRRLGGPRRPKMLLRCLQDSPRFDFQQKMRFHEPFELGWHFPFEFNPI